MKKIISIILVLGLLICTCGCEELVENINSDFVSEVQNQITEDSNSTVSSDEQKPKQEENTNSQKEKTESKQNIKQKENVDPQKEKTESKEKSSNTAKEESKEETVAKNETVIIKNQLPEVVYSHGDDVVYKDILPLKDGDFAAIGVKCTYDLDLSVLRICDSNGKVKKEHLFSDGNGYDKIATCTDGGYVAASYNPPYLTKISNDFRVEWVKAYYDVACEGIVQDIAQIGVEYAVLFAGTPYPTNLKITFLDEKGKLTKTIDLMKNTDISDGDIIPDGCDGFYLVLTCNENLANKFDLVKNEYNNMKADEVIILHFNSDKQLTFAKTIGGGGNDWIEESTIDNDGNIYLAVGTNWYGADSFWDMSVERSMPYRRMLVKLDKKGNIVYRAPLANKGMAVDQVFGIHIKDNKAYVVGMADYFDGYQAKYPCEQISPSEKGERIFCVYNASFDSNGKELDRKIFRCDVNNAPCDSVLLPNGALIIAGKVSPDENPFNLEFPLGGDAVAALFVYKE